MLEKTLNNILVTLNYGDDVITVKEEFVTKASEFHIKIPKIVRNKIAQDVNVSFEFELSKK